MLTKINFEAMTILRVFLWFAACSGSLGTLATAAEVPQAAGKAVSLLGRVLIRNEDKAGAPVRELKVGDTIMPGDVVNTRSDATVKLMMSDKSIIDLGASTLFKVDEWMLKHGDDRQVGLTLGYGKVRASVNTPVGPKGKFTVKTKAATMGVRGTEFMIVQGIDSKGDSPKGGADKSVTTQVTVVHGKVEFRDKAMPNRPPIEITTGKQLTTVATLVGDNAVQRSAANAPTPKVIDVPAPQMKTLLADTKVQDTTFRQAVVIDTGNKSQPSFGQSTMQSIMGAAPPPPQFGPKPGDYGLPGTFVPQVNTVPLNAPQPAVNLQVTFIRN